MAGITINSQADGYWDQTSTWDSGTVPTDADTVQIKHAVQISSDIEAYAVYIQAGGSLTVADTVDWTSNITAAVPFWALWRELDDTRKVNLDGVLLDGVVPSITSIKDTDSFPTCQPIAQDAARDVIISDPGYIGASATLQDIKPEGCARAYARKVSNNVRYMTVTVRIRASKPMHLGNLYRMAKGPFQVLLVTDRSMIKGYIENISPDSAAVGTEYITVKVTVAEGA